MDVTSWHCFRTEPQSKSSNVVVRKGISLGVHRPSESPISLAPCAFKVFERLIHGRIAPHICNRLDDSQGGFRWGADACVYGLVDALRLLQDTHEATLVRLHQSGVIGGMWRTIANFLCGTLSQVRVRGDVSPPWGWTQGLHRGACFHPCCLISW